ncbi:MAG: TlpA family protein disulfide reductase, partial [Chloroflexi bacterium]|nr:TlpA family protein disulfide reductase [Chloroflexota bacterium]
NRTPLIIGAAIIVGAALIAIFASLQGPGQSGVPGPSGASTIPPGAAGSSAPAGSRSSVPSGAAPSAAATQAPLPRFSPGPADAAVGQVIPEVEGASFDGTPVAIRRDGRAKLLLFLAHWCSHCQAEVPVVQRWVAAGSVLAGLDLISVATAIDPTYPNYPPEAWLAREGWSVPVIVDRSGQIAASYGLSAFPYWVVVNADGTVARRLTGELSAVQLDALAASVTTP